MMTILENFSVDGAIRLTDKEFCLISELVYKRFGINLTEQKKALVRGRLNTLVKSQGFVNFEDYYNAVVDDRTEGSLLSLIDRISTNHSFFFRETDHFDFLKSIVLPDLFRKIERNKKTELRIWCAGCAAGEEPYTLAMVLHEFNAPMEWDIGILATDISISALQQAKEGIYPSGKLEKVPAQYRKYFEKLDSDSYAVKNIIKRMVLYKRLNLMRNDFPFNGKFHLVFCRNVMIYFDQETRKILVAKLHRHMHEDGYLFIGHSESLGRESEKFGYIQPTVYKRC
jgi:chemotaxis protein methyltransferase CheR